MSSTFALPFYNVQTANSFTYAAANLNPIKFNNTYYPVGITGIPNYAKTALQYYPSFSFYPTFNPYPSNV